VRRVVAALALALCLLGCQLITAERVQLLTGVDSCWAGGETGQKGRLIVDPDYGTSFDGMPVMWPMGFTGERVGAEIHVRDGAGKVVATTGREYFISRGRVGSSESAQLMERVGAFPAAANCGYPWDFVDCGLAPSPYCADAASVRRTYDAQA